MDGLVDFERVVRGEQRNGGVDSLIVENLWRDIVQGTRRSSRLSNCVEMVRMGFQAFCNERGLFTPCIAPLSSMLAFGVAFWDAASAALRPTKRRLGFFGIGSGSGMTSWSAVGPRFVARRSSSIVAEESSGFPCQGEQQKRVQGPTRQTLSLVPVFNFTIF